MPPSPSRGSSRASPESTTTTTSSSSSPLSSFFSLSSLSPSSSPAYPCNFRASQVMDAPASLPCVVCSSGGLFPAANSTSPSLGRGCGCSSPSSSPCCPQHSSLSTPMLGDEGGRCCGGNRGPGNNAFLRALCGYDEQQAGRQQQPPRRRHDSPLPPEETEDGQNLTSRGTLKTLSCSRLEEDFNKQAESLEH